MGVMEILTTILSLLALIFLAAIFVLMIYALVFGAPFAALAQNRIETMVKLLKMKKGQSVVDLGSGDGRIVIAFARLGIEAHGYEINPVLVAWSRLSIRQLGLQKKAFIHFKSYWLEDLSKFDAVTVYGTWHMMARLERKLRKELKGGKVVSNYFKFPGLKAVREENKVWLYKV